jgi:hypothetical protein
MLFTLQKLIWYLAMPPPSPLMLAQRDMNGI